MSKRKATVAETVLREALERLQLQTCAATWMLRNKQPFEPETWLCVRGPRETKLLVRTNEDGFPSAVWHDSEVTSELQHHLISPLSDCLKEEEYAQCAAAIDAVRKTT